jgi:hypothetical protein
MSLWCFVFDLQARVQGEELDSSPDKSDRAVPHNFTFTAAYLQPITFPLLNFLILLINPAVRRWEGGVRFEIVRNKYVLWMSFRPKLERIPVNSQASLVCVQIFNSCGIRSAKRGHLDITL